jgi:hypothetical protein
MTNFFKKLTYRIASHFLWMKPYYLFKKIDEISGIDTIAQLNLMMNYKLLAAQKAPLPKINDVEFRVYSENGEDGILLYIFSLIGTTNKKAVEICCGDGIQNCTANLIINHGWQGHLFEGNPERVKTAKQFYFDTVNTKQWPPVIANEWIAPETINDTLKKHNCAGEVDLLSLDMDGVDYWVWDAITEISPRVFVCEFNNLWPADKALTVPNDKNFKADYNNKYGADFSGATLGAFVKLAKNKGYRLVGVQRLGYNAFFIKNGIGEEYFPEVDPATQLNHPYAVYARTERNKNVKDKNWVEV